MKRVDIIVATHKKYDMPEDGIYLPLHVGAANSDAKLKYKKDSTGKNISKKNPNFCELTGLYWAWKNLKSDYIGLVHYRRHFSLTPMKKDKKNPLSRVLTEEQVKTLISKPNNFDLILPKKRNYVIETLYSHYAHTLHVKPLDMTRDIIAEKYPKYLREFDLIKKRRSAHMFNMFIGRKKIMDEYCEWLFDILFALEEKIGDKKEYSSFHSRFYGRISELLFDVWLYTKYPETKKHLVTKKIRIKEVKVIDVEGTNILKKGTSFLLAKFFGKKYNKSF